MNAQIKVLSFVTRVRVQPVGRPYYEGRRKFDEFEMECARRVGGGVLAS